MGEQDQRTRGRTQDAQNTLVSSQRAGKGLAVRVWGSWGPEEGCICRFVQGPHSPTRELTVIPGLYPQGHDPGVLSFHHLHVPSGRIGVTEWVGPPGAREAPPGLAHRHQLTRGESQWLQAQK